MANLGRLAGDVGRTLGGYIIGQLKIAAILACIYTVGYALAQVPGWFIIGPISGLLNIIPLVGSLIGVGLALLMTLFDDGDVYRYLGVLAVWIIGQAIEGFWLTPKILGRRLQLKPLVVFLAVLFGGLLFGPIGVLVAAPVVAVGMVFWRFFSKPTDAPPQP